MLYSFEGQGLQSIGGKRLLSSRITEGEKPLGNGGDAASFWSHKRRLRTRKIRVKVPKINFTAQ